MKLPNFNLCITSYLLLIAFGCKGEASNEPATSPEQHEASESQAVNTNARPKERVAYGSNTYEQAQSRVFNWTQQLALEVPTMESRGISQKKQLAEYLSLQLQLYQNGDANAKKQIRETLKPIHAAAMDPAFHNLDSVKGTEFKKHSMSYMRIQYLFDQLGFDTSIYKEELDQVKKRMDRHLRTRGTWQRWAFNNYYDLLDYDKPRYLQNIQEFKGVIGDRLSMESYEIDQAYELVHLVFGAYNYGAKQQQTLLNADDFDYLKGILPPLALKYRSKNNRDLLAEICAAMSMAGVQNEELDKSIAYLLNVQNNDGTWGNYEKYREREGDDIEIKAYLHTTMVVFDALSLYHNNK